MTLIIATTIKIPKPIPALNIPVTTLQELNSIGDSNRGYMKLVFHYKYFEILKPLIMFLKALFHTITLLLCSFFHFPVLQNLNLFLLRQLWYLQHLQPHLHHEFRGSLLHQAGSHL